MLSPLLKKFPEIKEGNKGKAKGTKSTTSAEAKELFRDTLALQSLHVEQSLNKLRAESPEKFLNVYFKYCRFFMPVLTEDINTQEDKPIFMVNLGTGVEPEEFDISNREHTQSMVNFTE